MDEEQLALFPEPAPPPPDPMQAILDRLAALENENKQLRQAQLVQAQESQMPGHLVQGGQISAHPGVARHVVIGTRPVFDNPSDPLWGSLHKVDPGSLARKSES